MVAKTKKQTVTLGDPGVETLLTLFQEAKATIKAGETEKDNIEPLLKESIQKYVDEFPGDKLQFGVYVVNMVLGVRKSVDAKILLEAGVDPSIIERATVETSYTSMRVTRAD